MITVFKLYIFLLLFFDIGFAVTTLQLSFKSKKIIRDTDIKLPCILLFLLFLTLYLFVISK